MSLDAINPNQFGAQKNLLASGTSDQLHAMTAQMTNLNSGARAMQSYFSSDIPGLAKAQEGQGTGIQENINQE